MQIRLCETKKNFMRDKNIWVRSDVFGMVEKKVWRAPLMQKRDKLHSAAQSLRDEMDLPKFPKRRTFFDIRDCDALCD